ncbi:MAG TPA: hypothetical protein DCE41_04955 [Cytophagales bacterium]|nr:hypothetical protein [Cytophagales bacterium]HAA18865.1 hypothetical protein [Cytophagales bacterium]HAP62223.1 hypothetical protein [Cytophagales bacterium]
MKEYYISSFGILLREKIKVKQFAIILFGSLFLWLSPAAAQDQKRKAVYLELAGSGGLGSVNYEQSFAERGIADFTWRAGFSMAPIDPNNGVGLVFPVMVNTLVGPEAHQLEVGLGQGLTVTTRGSIHLLALAGLGYRYQSASSPWFFRATYTPLISYLLGSQWQHWGGLSLGYTISSPSK